MNRIKPLVLLTGFLAVMGSSPEALAVPRLRGDTTCLFGSRACNRCVEDVPAAVASLRKRPSARIRYTSMGDRVLPPLGARLAAFGAHRSHVQGIARIPGLPGSNWLVATRSRPGRMGGGGFFVIRLGDVPGRGGAPFGRLEDPLEFKRVNPRLRRTAYYHPIAGTDHPGGLSLLGRTLAVAASCDSADRCEGRAFVDFHDLSRPQARHTRVSRFELFRRGEPHRVRYASSVALARLAGGGLLMFVQGKDSEQEGWVYEARAGAPTGTTSWRYVDRIDRSKGFEGGYQNTTLLTDCATTDLYLLATGNPEFGPLSRGRERLRLFSVTRVGDDLRLRTVLTRSWKSRVDGFCSFRAGASAYVTPDGRLAIYCTARKANTDLLGNPDSKLKLTEFTGGS